MPKKWLLFISGIAWFFASTLLIRSGTFYMFDYSHHILLNMAVGFSGGFLFFLLVFYRIVRKHITCIVKMDGDRSGLVFFTGLKGFIAAAILVLSGLLLSRYQYIDMLTVHVFYICLGTTLFIASLKFFYSILLFKKLSGSNTSCIS